MIKLVNVYVCHKVIKLAKVYMHHEGVMKGVIVIGVTSSAL